ncbi:MAG: valine--tRNA ligase [Candidatus Heimdallarchaeota archaeon]|nr:valine--tRNA ligase [Candidatus Heimdallarchaeota archaeon]
MNSSKPNEKSKLQPKLEKHYNIHETEQRMQKLWASKEHYKEVYSFKFDDTERPLFAIDTPPPFTSGILHMGHAYWCSISDLIGRYKRMRGYNVLLPQGWDTQGLPTELKVQYKWKISRDDRQLFKKKCREWTELMIKDMKDVIYQIGYRPDWEAFEYRTMDPEYQTIVQKSLIKMFKDGDVYVDSFPNMWCTYCGTSIAQAETGYLEKKGFMNWVKFPIVGEKDEFIEIATTRPELLPACQAILVHPKDKRFKKYHGKEAIIPIVNRKIPIIIDDEVDMEFGTGAVMNCTFGDEQDIKWQQRHKLPIKQIISPDGKIENTGLRYDGMLIKDAQREIAIDLNKEGFMLKQERIKHRVLCHTERGDCETPMEFLTTKQFMVKIKDYAPKLLEAAKRMKWYPSFYLRRATDWISALEWDWIISRQRVFGTPIPFWTCADCNAVIPPAEGTKLPIDTSITPPPVNKCPKCGSTNIHGTTDVCDCWVDSSLTALIISRWFTDPEFAKKWITEDSKNIVRLQGHDIIRTWYTYTTFRTMKLTDGLLPFGNVLINGHVLGPDSLKMSKSRGNVVDPRDGIEKYGADAIRQTILSRKVGTDFPFLWDTAQYGKSFLQKLWSVSRFISMYIDSLPKDFKLKYSPIDLWLLSELEAARKEITKTMDEYEFHTSLKILYEFTWNKLCDNYLESVKPILRSNDEKRAITVRLILRDTLWAVLRMLAPFCPHITEEIYLKMFKDSIGKLSIHATSWPEKDSRRFNKEKVAIGEELIKIIAQIRQQKAAQRIALNQPLAKVTITLPKEMIDKLTPYKELIAQPLHIDSIAFQEGEELVVKLMTANK